MENYFFKDCKTEQETKTAYRQLSKILHPDIGGTDEQFKELNRQYHAKLKSLNGSYNSKYDESRGKNQYHYDSQIEEDLLKVLRALQGLRLPETINIDLQGTWIWVRGNLKNGFGHYPLPKQYIRQLEGLGLKHHTAKGECYYRDPKSRCSNKGKIMSYDRINKKFHGMKFGNIGADQIN